MDANLLNRWPCKKWSQLRDTQCLGTGFGCHNRWHYWFQVAEDSGIVNYHKIYKETPYNRSSDKNTNSFVGGGPVTLQATLIVSERRRLDASEALEVSRRIHFVQGRFLTSETPVTYTTEDSSRRAEQNTAVLQGCQLLSWKMKNIF